ncbi:kinesin [Schizophyllum fasciatum]
MAPSPSSSATTSVQVALRIRPTTNQDATSIPSRFQRPVIHAISSNAVSVDAVSSNPQGGPSPAPATGTAAKKQVFAFDQVHGPSTTQHTMFTTTAQPLISRFVEGFNCTILAYGQTSSGKTHTMTGVDLDADPSDPNNGMGIIPRAVSMIFSRCRQVKEERAGTWNFNLKGSFIELYNEDLIDLLGADEAGGARREVQIREDKDGHIIWGGLREVGVKNANEVMGLIRKGTSIRRTNETDMNAQSSRSHAIFSLTLTQKKYTGNGEPPRSSTPVQPGGRSPSRLARPGSVMGTSRVASPTFGHNSSNSFAQAMGRGGLRPSSALGHVGDRQQNGDDGEWVTIVSKFHFVDLAGSERLKRTAAAGERVKEGISINSGLLALGNVISALGDPARAKSHTATHVPYRDSKLTRLLQDSLGGNAHTLMIACVSAAEWNAAETINTLKYANRARNIKNRAVVNEKEDGWDDVEWLRGTVTRLRKEVKTLKEGGAIPSGNVPEIEVEGASKKVLSQMTELQNNYEDLREKFVERTEELTRLRRELGEKARGSTGGAVTGTAKYEEIVGPVIEEYEKTISAMEAELSLNRAALRHTNELVEEKEEELSALTERHGATELYVEELRSRVSKLSEREASTEAYVRDLEEKLRSVDESNMTSSESMSDLKRELARFKDTESYSTKYIADLEARLARSDESVIALQQTVERLEAECETRREEAESLQARLEALRRDGENWRNDLEAREARVRELELKMQDWEKKRLEANETRERLSKVVGNVVDEVEGAKKGLEVDLSDAGSVISRKPSTAHLENLENITHDDTAQKQLIDLQQTHQATLADLSSVTAKYRDALREISDLAAQIQEAKFGASSVAESRSESPTTDRPLEVPTHRRSPTGGRRSRDPSEQPSSSRRLFFRQAASVESLRARSLSQSLSLSQELSSAHSRKTSFSSQGTSSAHSPSNSQSMTYGSGNHSRPNLSISLSSNGERSVSSMEKEIMRLQEVLREREMEISALEESLKEAQDKSDMTSSELTEGKPRKIDVDLPIIVNGTSHENSDSVHLSPKTLGQFDSIRKSIDLRDGVPARDSDSDGATAAMIAERDESLARLNELMLSMAQKESQHREVVDDLSEQLTTVRRQLDDLTTLNRDQASDALNMSGEIDAMQRKYVADLASLEDTRKREAELVESLKKADEEHAAVVDQLRVDHEAAMAAKAAEVDELVTRLKAEHDVALSGLREELAAAAAALERSREDHEKSFGDLEAKHATELASRLKVVNELLSRTREEHEAALAKFASEHADAQRKQEDEANAVLHKTEEDYYNVLTKLRSDHAETLERQKAETEAALERLRDEHAAEMRMATIAQEGSLSESETARNLALKELQEEHAAAVLRKDSSFGEELERLKGEHVRVLATKEEDFTIQLEKTRAEHEGILSRMKETWRGETERLNNELQSAKEESSASATQLQKAFDDATRVLKEDHATLLIEVAKGHEEELARLRSDLDATLRETSEKHEAERVELTKSHAEEIAKLKAENQQTLAEVNASLVTLQAERQDALESARHASERSFAEEQERLHATLEDLKARHAQEVETWTKDRALLVQELEAEKAAADKLAATQQSIEHTHLQVLDEKDAAIESIKEDLTSVSSQRDGFESELETLRSELAQHREEHLRLLEEARGDKATAVEKLTQELATTADHRDDLEAEVATLRAELDKTRKEQSRLVQEASKRDSLVDELERHRSMMAEMQDTLQKVKDEKDTLQTEKTRSDSMLRDLQAQLARSSSPPAVRSPVERNTSFNRTNLPPMKLPPPTPPPSVPPPPAPRHMNGDANGSVSSAASSALTSSTSSRDSTLDSPATSVATPTINGPDPKMVAKMEEQAKHIDEQEAMIKTLNKQLSHCESDLQTHMDLVSTLETSLGDSEKNLRKARMHATELARERDTLNTKMEALRRELEEAKREVTSVRRSIVEEKQSLEQRLDEERRAKERARQQLDSRMEELQKRKSKFACL